MVIKPDDYRWSSYHAHARGIDSQLWTPHPQYLQLGGNKVQRIKAYRELFSEVLSAEEVDRIRDSLEKGHALGNDRFRTEMERLTGIRQRRVKSGPKRKAGPGKEKDNRELLLRSCYSDPDLTDLKMLLYPNFPISSKQKTPATEVTGVFKASRKRRDQLNVTLTPISISLFP